MCHHDTCNTHLPDTFWNRNKGKILGTLAAAATVVAGSQIYARHNDHKWMKENGLYDKYLEHLTPED